VHRRFQLIVGGVFVAFAVFLEAVESFKVLREIVPEKLSGMINQLDVVLLFFVGILFLWLGKNPDKEGSQSSPAGNTANAGNATANATGNKVEQHFHLNGYPIDELADAIAQKLKTGETVGISAKDEKEAAAPPLLTKGDGFIQLEEVNLEVSAAELAVGGTVRAKYFYANRGVLPVYEVQTWGLMQILDQTLNSGPHLKAVMRAAAKDGHSKFPEAATVGVQLKRHAFAALNEPFTQNQLEALEDKSMSLFLLVGGVWVDNQGQTHFWAECQIAEFYQGLSWERFNWRTL
jgi:hypothetical protein